MSQLTQVDVDATAPSVVGVDLGGTSIKAAIVGPCGIQTQTRRPTPTDQGPAAILDAVMSIVTELIETARSSAPASPARLPGAIGIGVPAGSEETGRVVAAANLGWKDLALRDLVASHFGLPVKIGHDARVAGLAEWRWGAGRGATDMFFVTVGTGIAAAVVAQGQMVTGGGFAGEVGHGGRIDGEACPCGGRGCLETYASAAAIARAYSAATGRPVDGAIDVVRAMAKGDQTAGRVWDQAAAGLGQTIADAVRLLGCARVVIGGGLAEAGEILLEPVRQAVQARLTVHPLPDIRRAAFGESAGTYGAALLAWQALGVVA